ncbi:ATP-binding protein [Rhodococcus gannanensis]|uniref:ATP-binding protein n=1 Tax=Rhodococcus gannanensis TaxID=1960308 RepID=A0ABW4P3B7_9NOCA
MEFAALLRRLREQRSLSQEELAERAGVTVKAVGALERGERLRPYPNTVRALADALTLDDSERAELVAAVPRREPAPAPPNRRVVTTVGDPLSIVPVTPLLGRDETIDHIGEVVVSGRVRLLTLTGPGGVGKTRIALAVLARCVASFSGGAAFVDLTTVREPGQVLPRLGAALGVTEGPAGVSAEGLAAHLTGRRVLVVLDNLEQMLAAAPAIADLVGHAPDLVVLATSRAPLRVRAEYEVPVPPLAVPDDDGPDAVAASPAVAMFLDRAAAAGADLDVDDANAAALAAIVRRLDGLPLALELAAARARLLPPALLSARLDAHGMDAELVGPQDLPDRQRTMAAVLDWSADLLDPSDRDLWTRLAVFSGGFSLDAVEALDPMSAPDVLPALSRLVDHSLVAPLDPPDEQPRFRLLEPVRQYAAARLHVSGAALEVANSHARQQYRVAVAAHDRLQGAGIGPVLDRLDADHGNLRSAFLRLIELDRPGDAAELAGSVWMYLALRGRTREGLAWLDRVQGTVPETISGRAAVGRMGLLLVVGDLDGIRKEADAYLPTAPADDPVALEAATIAGLAAAFSGDSGALRLLDGVLDRAEPGWLTAHARLGLGQLALVSGDVDVAQTRHAEAVAEARRLGNEFTLATVLNSAASVCEAGGDDSGAAAMLGESLDLSVRLRLGWSLGYTLPAVAGLAARTGNPAGAAALYGAAARLNASDAVDPHFPPARSTADAGLDLARDTLGEKDFLAEWESGRTATAEQVASIAARVIDDVTNGRR